MQFGVEIACGSSRIEMTTFGGGKTVFLCWGKQIQSSNFLCVVCLWIVGCFFNPLENSDQFSHWQWNVCFFFIDRNTFFIVQNFATGSILHCVQDSKTQLGHLDWYMILCFVKNSYWLPHIPLRMLGLSSVIWNEDRWSEQWFSHLRGSWLCYDTWIIQQGINHYIVIEVIGEQICFLVAVLIILGLVGPQETVEPDGIEVLSLLTEQVMNYSRTNGPPQGRWRILPQREREWVAATTNTPSPQFYPCKKFLSLTKK